ncbi:undecaprenyldiphospho-muramoylpentapeptide beta-N-acetylglucosaminyltransferase [Muriicola sp. Z0-33]|uniref:undecaprenyldiphospho-muramoylpentapeptide beta-N-acetylglucosaminyltransferase n=1 Tax=Muriicola sp. Z0-33 TaxID=2816957 RepID=UPI0022373DB6|nr:undecaprenyldiphospho-muramoylpentapeptide beta-N-acetylglucosaminyltransferase [Muriicola sp. Z0-33]MCW5516052.1 undecaprenyldiphospho-muramoylpentapeptide beta-N-acetylglucosaminyltransferase [Muriicola sp. Z0-33]
MDNYKFILSGGGTGGHIYPAIAIANELALRYPDAEFLFVGAKDKMEMEKVPQAGYKIIGLWISGLQRKLSPKNLMFPIKLISSLMKAARIVSRFKPNVVIGTGGFASGPVLKMASVKGIPCVLQEQNSYAGITNKLLAAKAAKICVAYNGMEQFFPPGKIVKTGNPVRDNIIRTANVRGEALDHFGLDPEKTTLLIIGGSLGARRINEMIADRLQFFSKLGLQLIWQCGKLYFEEYKQYQTETVRVYDFMNRMDLSYAAADIIISRAGAGSVSELCIVGKPVIFIPSPNVAEDHQTKNAEALLAKNAALLVKENDIETHFETVFSELLLSVNKREEIGNNMKAQALPAATKHIVDEIVKLL